ncbi:hypothetical protein N7474_004554 [Penicillium riverlandense]|uniref:uncharacterized protein n=1 Tax=Penicillium riverlandense TaxID=1903569 RepID=UPI00254667D0|nr:uncharacterized protein N7474_004554 [Penicillium riverlandense]KAJ5818963.1 hypothetical protein N7474_004554 [Penicillium riverlandense]
MLPLLYGDGEIKAHWKKAVTRMSVEPALRPLCLTSNTIFFARLRIGIAKVKKKNGLKFKISSSSGPDDRQLFSEMWPMEN